MEKFCTEAFPSPRGVMEFERLTKLDVGLEDQTSFRPLAGYWNLNVGMMFSLEAAVMVSVPSRGNGI